MFENLLLPATGYPYPYVSHGFGEVTNCFFSNGKGRHASTRNEQIEESAISVTLALFNFFVCLCVLGVSAG